MAEILKLIASEMTLVYSMFAVFILGIITFILAWQYKNRHYKGKYRCIFFSANQRVISVLLRPDENDMFEWEGNPYSCVVEYIRISRNPFGDPLPSLSYVEGRAAPLEPIENWAADIKNVASNKIYADFTDESIKQLAAIIAEEAKDDLGDGIALKRKMYSTLIYGFAILSIINVIGYYYIAGKL